jgi:predicted nucleic acid-binding Zn ribbon protein
MPTRTCAICETPIPDDVPAVQSPVTISLRRNGRGRTLRRVICEGCAATYRAESPDGRRRAVHSFQRRERTNCVVCDLPVLLPVDKRRKVDACSDLCRSRFYAKPVEPAVTACEGCGSATTGRSDLRFCSPACRQRAYRRRTAADVSSKS